MSYLRSFGWVANDLQPRRSQRDVLYVTFGLIERIGHGDSARKQYFEVWAWDKTAQSLLDGGVKKGSRIWIGGLLELVDYLKKDGKTRDKRMKVRLQEWSEGQFDQASDGPNQKETGAACDPDAIGPMAVVDGERECLPE